jgi:carbonic anhydrase
MICDPSIDNSKAQTKESQKAMTPGCALQLLKEGNERFREKRPLVRDLLKEKDITAEGQYPFAVILSCIDSRVPTALIFDQGIGDIFTAAVAGNFVNQDILGSMEFACKVAGAKLVLVLGHTRCGAINAAIDAVLKPTAVKWDAELKSYEKEELSKYNDVAACDCHNITPMIQNLEKAVKACLPDPPGELPKNFADLVVRKNVELTVKDIRKRSKCLKHLKKGNRLLIKGAIYDVVTGKVEFL